MARLVLLEHEYQRGRESMVYAFAEHWRAEGHSVAIHRGVGQPPEADLAILHLDISVVPPEYEALLRFYPRVLNGKTLDISKRGFSQQLLAPGDPWRGPVIVKTNANYQGFPEALIHQNAKKAGRDAPVPPPLALRRYPLFHSLAEVEQKYWSTPGIIVERFLPERDQHGRYCVRVWTFFGERERCVMWHSNAPVVKATNTVERTPIDPPRSLRQWRERLGFDFGKFDYVVHEGQEVLLDVNRTPSFPTQGSPNALAAAADLARGIEGFLPS